jgi:hypothetical protein
MTFSVVVSSGFVVDLSDDEAIPPGFYRKGSWRSGMYALSTKPTNLEDDDLSRLSDALSRALFEELAFFESAAPVLRFRASGRGGLQLLMTFEPKQGAVVIPAAFIRGWGELGGTISIDIPLDP